MKKLFSSILIAVVVLLGLNVNALNSSAATKAYIKQTNLNVKLYVGQTKALTFTSSGLKNKKVKWQSSNSSIASVNSSGKITALKAGTANITVTSLSNKVKSTSKITITKKALTAKEAFSKVNPTVVYIEAYNKYNQAVASGSGFIISKDGTIVTNHHVVVDVSEITKVKVKLWNGIVYETSKVIGYNANKDIVILKINGPTNLPVSVLGDSSKVSTGEKVYALGSPEGVQNTITEGIVSNRNVEYDKNYFIQTSAPINHGNSGGVLVNAYGEVIGINDWGLTNTQNMNYAIPINVLKSIPKNLNKTLLEVNREYYVAASGEGDNREEETNNDFDEADGITTAEGITYGSLGSNQDADFYYFLITDYKSITFVGSTLNPQQSRGFAMGLYDVSGELITTSTIRYDDTKGSYFSDIQYDLEPGYYFVVVYPEPGVDVSYFNEQYAFYHIID